MKETRFDPNSDLVIVRARVWGRYRGESTSLSLALDTGSSETVIRTSAIRSDEGRLLVEPVAAVVP